MVVCDNVGLFAHESSEYTDFVRSPTNGCRSILMPYQAASRFPHGCRDCANEAPYAYQEASSLVPTDTATTEAA